MSLPQVSLVLAESIRRVIPALSKAEAAILSQCRPVESRAARPNSHWQCNGALLVSSGQFAKYGEGESPAKHFAEKVVGDLLSHRPAMVESASVSGPGFITITADKSWLWQNIVSEDVSPVLPKENQQNIIIDMSSPNIAKRMHVGHIRSTVIGEALANLLQAQGHAVVKINHIGDFGTQFGVLMAAMKSRGSNLDQLDIGELDELYRSGKQNKLESFLAQCRQHVVLLQNGDPETTKLWRRVKDISKKDYDIIYSRLGINGLVERGESFYLPYLKDTVSELLDSEIAETSNGAICVFNDFDSFPLIIRKSDGGYTYDTTDLAALRYRFQVDHADQIIYVVDHGQAKHFELVFATGKKAGWIPANCHCRFVGFGVVLGPDGKRFRTRQGNAVPLSLLLDAAVEKAKTVLSDRNFDASETVFQSTSEAIGTSAIKYAHLSRQRDSNIAFDMDSMLDFKGNTSIYLQYTLCRALRILNEVGQAPEHPKYQSSSVVQDGFERELSVVALRLPDAVTESASILEPHILCHYLYSLASSMNSFYSNCPVLQNERQQIRIAILRRAAKALESGLRILGINIIERM